MMTLFTVHRAQINPGILKNNGINFMENVNVNQILKKLFNQNVRVKSLKIKLILHLKKIFI